MNWIAISGSWRTTNHQVESDVRREVSHIIGRGDGIVTGGALGVDYIATDEALKHDPKVNRIQVFLPTSLTLYQQHYFKRAREKVITTKQAQALISQLTYLQGINPCSLIEGPAKTADQHSYYLRHLSIISLAERLLAFQVNQSQGTQDTINKAKVKGIPVTLFSYTI